MRKAMTLCALLGLALLCGCAAAANSPAAAEPVAQQTAAGGTTAVGQAAEDAPDWSEYEPFGLVWDRKTDVLTYEGVRVRYFQDFWPVGGGAQAGREHVDGAGAVDVHALRDLTKRPDAGGSYDPSGVLLGLEADSPETYGARDLDALLYPDPGVTCASEGEPETPEERAALYAVYAPFGLTYDAEADCFRFNGERVRYFLDVMVSNGEAPAGGRFRGSLRQTFDGAGAVDVRAVRDQIRTDGEGLWPLTGVEAYSQAEFDARPV